METLGHAKICCRPRFLRRYRFKASPDQVRGCFLRLLNATPGELARLYPPLLLIENKIPNPPSRHLDLKISVPSEISVAKLFVCNLDLLYLEFVSDLVFRASDLEEKMGMLKEFREFAVKGNVIDMAVGIIIGAAFGQVVNSLVKDVIMPPIGLITGKIRFENLFVKLSADPNHYTVLADAQKANIPTLNYGLFINVMINFVIVAFAVFILIKQINHLKRLHETPAPAQQTKECPQCISKIPQKASRCPFCTSQL